MAAVSSAENGYTFLIRVNLQYICILNIWIKPRPHLTVLLQIPVCLKRLTNMDKSTCNLIFLSFLLFGAIGLQMKLTCLSPVQY